MAYPVTLLRLDGPAEQQLAHADEALTEAMLVYDELRRLLHAEPGVAPSGPTQELHRGLLGA